MFNSLRGIITEKRTDSLFLDSGGVEWDLAMPATDIDALPPQGEEGRVFTWLYHKEDQMKLYGFASPQRRATFMELLKVEGIGPRGALKIMGGIGQEELERALETEDLGRLEVVPGLGKKTAQKMILALKGRLARVSQTLPAAGPYAELAEALAAMGYDKRAAAEALSKADAAIAPAVKGPDREKQLFKRAIMYLSGV
ncbi:MAG: Holliday junction branch migration protein RuvA [Treponema sp.]|jgi:Holliday junction DNA helicase RuvA|nr:Holliday junction branch migration protein RuvA [Treponema sp.]